MDSVKCFNIKAGINLYYIPVTKFKTIAMSINFHRQLKKEEASLNALLTDVMRRGCSKYPNDIALSKSLQELYGASFHSDIRRKGEDQILSFMAGTVADKFIDSTDNAQKTMDLLFEMILNPLVENGAFKEEYVNQEKINLKNDIEAIINDKRSYSVWRLIEIMCKEDNYGTHELGTVEDVDKITPQSLYKHYQKVISQGPIDIIVTGDVDISKVCAYMSEKFANINPTVHHYPTTSLYETEKELTETIEEFDVTQAKLCLGFKTNIRPDDDRYYALMVYNGILGSGAHSKLFNNVREKLSLAYYASTRLERFKGLMIVSSGIEISNKQKALDEIFVQVECMKKGEISDYEFDASVKSIVNSLNSLSDDIGYLEDYYLGQIASGTNISLQEYAEKIEKVTLQDVVDVAKLITPDTIYFLTGRANGEEEA